MVDEDQIAALLERLVAVPEQIAKAVAGWDIGQLRALGPADGWSAAEILAHLRASDDIFVPRFYAVLTRDNPPLLDFDERRWAEVASYSEARFAPSLTAFRMRRLELVSTLRRAEPAEWLRIGTHETRGPLTLLELAESLLAHEEEHCAQLRAMPAPW